MDIGQRIKELRNANNMTQKQLADLLFVTPQALSKWEAGENEPSLDMVNKLAKTFKVSVSYLMCAEDEEKEQVEVKENSEEKAEEKKEEKKEAAPQVIIVETKPEPQKPILAICQHCGKPLYDSKEIFRSGGGTYHKRVGRRTKTYSSSSSVLCRDCEKARLKAIMEAEKQKEKEMIEKQEAARKRSYVLAVLIPLLALAIFLPVSITKGLPVGAIIGISIAIFLLSPLIGTLFLNNTFVPDMFLEVCSWGFVKWPGLIFSLDLDGIIWLLTVKLFLWILGFMIGAFFVALAVSVCYILSLFVYPYALYKSYKMPLEYGTAI